MEAFDALASAMLLLGLADEKAMHLAARHRYSYDNRIGAHSQSADGICFPALLADLIEENFANQLRAASIERRSAAIDVIVARAAGRQLKITQAKRFPRQHFQELLSCSRHKFLR